jgi:hypothetical protein
MHFFFSVLLGLLSNYSSNSFLLSPSSTNDPFISTPDTVFLRKIVFDTVLAGKPYHIYNNVYIDNNRDSKNHGLLADFSFTEEANLIKYTEKLKKRNIRLSKIPAQGLPTEWIPLNVYKNKYYLYMPSDGGYLNRRMITDSLLVFWLMEGPTPYPLQSITKKDAGTWAIRSTDLFVKMEGFTRPEILNIYIIDPKTNMAVWEYKSETEKNYSYELCIPRENIKDFDIIVNDGNEKSPEFDFDKIDFKKLLKQRPGK